MQLLTEKNIRTALFDEAHLTPAFCFHQQLVGCFRKGKKETANPGLFLNIY